MDLDGRVAVVSGGCSGIGGACADRLSAEGATVVRWDVNPDADVVCDVTDAASIDNALAETIGAHGVPTLHVAAAGVGGGVGLFHEYPIDAFDHVVAVNLRGVFLTMRAIAGAMIAADLDGSLVAIASVNGIIADPAQVGYSTTKAALFHMCRIAAIDLGRFGIRVNAVGPGPTATPMLQAAMDRPGYEAEVEAATPLGKLGRPEFIADAVAHIMQADWITGQGVLADGGSSLATARGASRLMQMLGHT